MAEALAAGPAFATFELEEARMPLMDLRESVEAMPEPEFTLRDRLNDYSNKLRYTGRKAVAGITALGIGFGGVGMSVEEGVAQAQKLPVAEMASSTWSHLGGDPLRANVDTRNEYVSLITSSKGGTAMKFAGLNGAERKAVRMGARTGNFRQCHMAYGEHFKKMSFGINGTSVDSDVTFKDPRYKNHSAPAWCETVTVKGKNGKSERIEMLVPFKCGNVAIKKIVHLKHVGKHKAPKQPTPAEVCSGNTTNTSNTSGSSATGQAGNCSTVTVTVTENQTPPQSPPPEQQPTPQAPTIQLETHQQEGIDAGTSEVFCADGHDNPASDNLQASDVKFNAVHGSFGPTTESSSSIPGDERFCATLTEAPDMYFTDERVSVTATDRVNGHSTTDTTDPFPVTQPI